MTTDMSAKLSEYLEELAEQLPNEPQKALKQIQGTDRRLLALRGYFRYIERNGINEIRSQWAWTDQQFNAFWQSERGRAMRNEVQNLLRHFNNDNPGYQLRTAPTHRPLEVQISLWNRSQSVRRIGRALAVLTSRELARIETVLLVPPYLDMHQSNTRLRSCVAPRTVPMRQPAYLALSVTRKETPPYLHSQQSRPDIQQSSLPPVVEIKKRKKHYKAYLDRFKRFLIRQRLENPTSATPGLSLHGQARAIDFIVSRNNQMIVGPSNPQLWRTSGWAARLDNLIHVYGPNFRGPLRNPDEPWHYNYIH